MSFLAPLFFVALSAIAIPVLVHLIQRERKRVIEFPSLMFIQKIPYQSVRRRRIRHWFLLLMRIAALLLIIAAFARPFFSQGADAMVPLGGDRGRATLVLFNKNAEENMRATSDRGRLVAALAAAKVTSGGTKYGSALKL